MIPTAIHIANRVEAETLLAAIDHLARSLRDKEKEFAEIVKLGRTHLQDAVPMTLGQEFSGYAVQIEKAHGRIRNTLANLEELALGGRHLAPALTATPTFPPPLPRGSPPIRDFPSRVPPTNSRRSQAATRRWSSWGR